MQAQSFSRFINKIFVLTIERNTERHPHVNAVLEGVDFQFWYGLDAPAFFKGKKHVAEIDDVFFIDNNVDKAHVSYLSIGQFGAYFSIRKMINHIAEKAYEATVIFEDDIQPLQKKWKLICEKAFTQLPDDWDILFLGYDYDGPIYKLYYKRHLRVALTAYYWLKKKINGWERINRYPKRFTRNLDISGFSMGGHAFCISKKGAALLSSHLNPMKDSGDVLLSQLIRENKIKAFSVYPCLFSQDRRKFGSKTRV